LFGWLAVNYLTGKLAESNVSDSYGAMDLGGASVEISFVPQYPPPSTNHIPLQVGKVIYDTYAYSYLGYGNDQARGMKDDYVIDNGWTVDPCTPIGYSYNATSSVTQKTVQITGSSNYTGCKAIAQTILNLQDGTIGGNYQPPIPNILFYGSSAFYYARDAIPQLQSTVTIADFVSGAANYCSQTYAQLPTSDPFRSTNCFLVTWATILLTDAFGFPDNYSVSAVSSINSVSLTYAIGAMLSEATLMQIQILDNSTSSVTPVSTPTQTPTSAPIKPSSSAPSSTSLAIQAVLGLVILCVFLL